MALLGLVMLLLTGCALGPREPGLWSGAVGQDWALTRIDGREPLPGSGLSITFAADGRVIGHAGANRFFGTYESRPDGSLHIGALGTTRMYRDDPPGLMRQEQRYLERLATVDAYQVDVEELRLLTEGRTVLRYAKNP